MIILEYLHHGEKNVPTLFAYNLWDDWKEAEQRELGKLRIQKRQGISNISAFSFVPLYYFYHYFISYFLLWLVLLCTLQNKLQADEFYAIVTLKISHATNVRDHYH